jgi:malate dehydrogenase (oxaloacetate-decarboxylating)(NADP+)
MSNSSTPHSPRRGIDWLRDPATNKGTAFTAAERDALGLRGLLPPRVATIEEQAQRMLANLRGYTAPLHKYVALEALHGRNTELYYRLLTDHLEELMPIAYTPTVGEDCQHFGHIFQQARGLYVSIEDRGRVAQLLANWPEDGVDIVVVTDGERILGLGDLGANGMGIAIGKLALYVACAGIHPRRKLPVLLDVGTNNLALRGDPLYLGLNRPRATGAEYDALVDEFMTALAQRFPGVVVQFEDFANHHAFELLARWRERLPSFNDDIQGTAAVAVAGLLSALRATGGKAVEQRLLFLGAGEAATGIADLYAAAVRAEGVAPDDARRCSWLFDSKGLVVAGRADLAAHKRAYAHAHAPVADFAAAVEALRPTAIIGVSAVAGAFDERVLRALAACNARPIVFALSNPTSRAECTAEQAYRCTDGRALFASGSPFGAVEFNGRRHVPRQGNNAYVFPGIGLGAIVSRTRAITDEMFLTAARTLAGEVSDADLAQGSLYPPLAQVRQVSARIAAAVASVAWAQGLSPLPCPSDLPSLVRASMYEPGYRGCAAAGA